MSETEKHTTQSQRAISLPQMRARRSPNPRKKDVVQKPSPTSVKDFFQIGWEDISGAVEGEPVTGKSGDELRLNSVGDASDWGQENPKSAFSGFHKPVKKGGSANASLDFTINVLKGERLATPDTSVFGNASSNPYVIVSVLTEEGKDPLLIGKTEYHQATLNPKWNTTFNKSIPPGTFSTDNYVIELKVMDYQVLRQDQCIGTVRIPMNLDSMSTVSEWYDVARDSTELAGGRIQVALETKMVYSMDAFLQTTSKSRTSNTDKRTEVSVSSDAFAPVSPSVKRTGTTLSSAAVTAASRMFGAGNMKVPTMYGAASMVALKDINAGSVEGASAAVGVTTKAALGISSVTRATNATSAAANKMAGVFTAPTALLRKRNTSTNEGMPNPDEYENVYKDEPALMVQVTLHQGDGLTAKDRNAIGMKVSSDPYVILEIWPKGLPMAKDDLTSYPCVPCGRSPTCNKTLSPVWNYSYEPCNVHFDQLDLEEAHLRIRIMNDSLGLVTHDLMGTIDIHLQPDKILDIQEKWYPVSAISAPGAGGRIQLSLQTLQATSKKLIGRRKKIVLAPGNKVEEDIQQSHPEIMDAETLDDASVSKDEEAAAIAAALATADQGRHSGARKTRLRKVTSDSDIMGKRRSRRPRGERSSTKTRQKRRCSHTQGTEPTKATPGSEVERKVRRSKSSKPSSGGAKPRKLSHSAHSASVLKEAHGSNEMESTLAESQRRDKAHDGEKKRKSGRRRMDGSSRHMDGSSRCMDASSRRMDSSSRHMDESDKNMSSSRRISDSRRRGTSRRRSDGESTKHDDGAPTSRQNHGTRTSRTSRESASRPRTGRSKAESSSTRSHEKEKLRRAKSSQSRLMDGSSRRVGESRRRTKTLVSSGSTRSIDSPRPHHRENARRTKTSSRRELSKSESKLRDDEKQSQISNA